MADLEHDIRAWVDTAVDGVAPVTAAEAMGQAAGARRPPRRHGWIAAAAAVILAVTGAVALHGGGDDSGRVVTAASDATATSAPTPSTTAPPAATSIPGAAQAVPFDGAYTGAGTYTITDPACPGIGGSMQADVTLDGGEPWQFDNPTCGTISTDDVFSSDGTFTLTDPAGDTLSGTSYTSVPRSDMGGPIDLAVTDGTGRYAGFHGRCQLENQFTNTSFGHQTHEGTISCTVGPNEPASTTPTVPKPSAPPIVAGGGGETTVTFESTDGTVHVLSVAPGGPLVWATTTIP